MVTPGEHQVVELGVPPLMADASRALHQRLTPGT